MKKLLIIIFISLIGCTPPKKSMYPREVSIYAIDFSEYSKKNFLFTPYRYLGDYESLGLVTVEIRPMAKLVKKSVDTGTGVGLTKDVWEVEKIKMGAIIEEVYKKAINMGANAVVDLEINTNFETLEANSTNPVTVNNIEISGFAIKRLGAFK